MEKHTFISSNEAFQGGFCCRSVTRRLFGKGKMSLSLVCYNTIDTVLLNLWDTIRNLYNLLLLVLVCEDQPQVYV